MQRLPSRVRTDSPDFTANHGKMTALVAQLRERIAKAREGGGPRYLQRHREQGKLPARERIDRLLDEGSPFLELSPLAAFTACAAARTSRGSSGCGRTPAFPSWAASRPRACSPRSSATSWRARTGCRACISSIRAARSFRCRRRSSPTGSTSAASSSTRRACRRNRSRRSRWSWAPARPAAPTCPRCPTRRSSSRGRGRYFSAGRRS